MVRRGISAIAALAALGMAAGASAQTVILHCTITSSSMINMPIDKTFIYRVGGTSWLEWSNEGGEWGRDLCKRFEYVPDIACQFTPKQFNLSGSYGAVRATMSVNRESGALTASSSIATERRNERHSATGTCEPGTEPAAPKMKF